MRGGARRGGAEPPPNPPPHQGLTLNPKQTAEQTAELCKEPGPEELHGVSPEGPTGRQSSCHSLVHTSGLCQAARQRTRLLEPAGAAATFKAAARTSHRLQGWGGRPGARPQWEQGPHGQLDRATGPAWVMGGGRDTN